MLYTVAAMDLTAAFLAIAVLSPTLAKHVLSTKTLVDKETAAANKGGVMPASA